MLTRFIAGWYAFTPRSGHRIEALWRESKD
jgi:hypothetical protein